MGELMRFRKLAVLAAAVVTVAGLSAGTAVTAHASVSGMTESSQNNAYAWRTQYAQETRTRLWDRDICCDVYQHLGRTYAGTVQSTGCLAGASQSLQDAYASVGVWVFNDPNNYFIGAATGNLGEDGNNPGHTNNLYDFWMWFSNGALGNCGQSVYWNALDFVCGHHDGVAIGAQLYVRGFCGTSTWTWTTV
jgi:hypothetical protein